MKFAFAVVAAAGLSAGVAQAATIDYTFSGTISLLSGVDTDGLNGALFTYTASFDDDSNYIDSFGFAATVALSGTPTVTISGSSVGANNTSVGFASDMAFYPTFAGNFSHPAGLQPVFVAGGGSQFEWIGNTFASAGAFDASIGSDVQLNDFAPASYFLGSGSAALTDLVTGTAYALVDVSITAVPAPTALAMLGLGGLVATRRRR